MPFEIWRLAPRLGLVPVLCSTRVQRITNLPVHCLSLKVPVWPIAPAPVPWPVPVPVPTRNVGSLFVCCVCLEQDWLRRSPWTFLLTHCTCRPAGDRFSAVAHVLVVTFFLHLSRGGLAMALPWADRNIWRSRQRVTVTTYISGPCPARG